jgi:integrase
MSTTTEPLSIEEYVTLVEAAHEHSFRHGFTVYLLGEIGLRRGEAAHFRPEWFDSDQQLVTVPRRQDDWIPSTNYGHRRIPVSTATANNLMSYIDALDQSAFGVAGSTIYDRVTTAGECAGIDRVSPRILRHTYAGRLAYSGIDSSWVSRILGVEPEIILSYDRMIRDPPTLGEDWNNHLDSLSLE